MQTKTLSFRALRMAARSWKTLTVLLALTGMVFASALLAQRYPYPDLTIRISNLTADAAYDRRDRVELQRLHGQRIRMRGTPYVDPSEREGLTKYFWLTPHGFPDHDSFLDFNPYQRLLVECREPIDTAQPLAWVAVCGRFRVEETNYQGVKAYYKIACDSVDFNAEAGGGPNPPDCSGNSRRE